MYVAPQLVYSDPSVLSLLPNDVVGSCVTTTLHKKWSTLGTHVGSSKRLEKYSGDALRSFNVQPTSQLRRDVRKRLFSLRIWSPRYKHVNKGNSNVKQSFDHSVTVRKSVPGVKLGVINCQSISGKLDFVFDHIKEYQLDIVALTETWLSSEDSKNKHVIDQCVAHGYSLHHSPRTSGRRGGGVGLLVSNAIKVTFKRIHVSPLITSFELMEAVLTICSVSLRLIVIYFIYLII